MELVHRDWSPRKRRGHPVRIARWLLMLLLTGSLLSLAQAGAAEAPASTGAPASASSAATSHTEENLIPNVATDGVLTIVIPKGTAAAIAAEGHGYVLPPVIRLHVGDRIVIENQDVQSHIVLYAFVRPGETDLRTMDHPGSETYSAGCSTDHLVNGFTSIFVNP